MGDALHTHKRNVCFLLGKTAIGISHCIASKAQVHAGRLTWEGEVTSISFSIKQLLGISHCMEGEVTAVSFLLLEFHTAQHKGKQTGSHGRERSYLKCLFPPP